MNSRAAPDHVPIEAVRRSSDVDNRWCGFVRLAGEAQPRHLLIFQSGQGYAAIPAACPHEGFRLDHCPVDERGQIVCPAHGHAVRIEGNADRLDVHRDGERFSIILQRRAMASPIAPDDELQRLRDELAALREANAALENQIVAVSEQMEAMVGELSDKTLALENFGVEQQRMSAFVGRVMDTMDNLVLLLDRKGCIQRVNPVVDMLLGYAVGNLLGQHADMLIPERDLERLRATLGLTSVTAGMVLFRSVLARGHVALEVNLQGPNGNTPSLLLHGAPLYDMAGKLEGVVIVGSDVTTLRSREQALIESEQRFRDYSDIASDWLWETDAELRFKPLEVGHESSDPVRNEMRARYSQIVGRRVEELAHREDLLDADKWARFQSICARRLEYRDFEFRAYQPGGPSVWLSSSGRPMFGPDGEFRGYRGIGKDITARKEIDAELRRHRDHLSDLVNEQTADLVRARDAAEQASRMKSEFLANISHELRTPLHGVLSFAAIGLQRATTGPPEKLRDYFERIRQSGQRLSALVDDLLDLARLEAGRSTMNCTPTDILALERSLRSGAEGLLAAKHLQVNVDIRTPDTRVVVDAQRISQVLLNLLSNAIKFSHEHSVLTWVIADDVLGPDGSEPRKALRVSLEDQGVGIPEDELDAIFDKFVQSSKTKSGAGGTGLGLAICREIVNAHGGRITARNTPLGAAFDVLLPRTFDTPRPVTDQGDNAAA
jgi:PAS domain S-box-containing protein